MIKSLRAWSERRRLRREARTWLKEARRIRHRYRHRLTPAQLETLQAHLAGVEGALRRHQPLEAVLPPLVALLDGELSFAKKSTVRQYAESLGGVVFVSLLLRSFVVEAYQIPSGSMIPTLQVGDHIWVNKMVYGLRIPFTEIKLGMQVRPPKRGEIIVFSHPQKRDDNLIKRVVAVGGDTVEMRDNVVSVNGVATARADQGPLHYFDFDEARDRWFERDAERYQQQIGAAQFVTLQDPGSAPSSFPPVRVPDGQLFVMGDNRDNSSDSRYWGFVPLNLVRGRAMVVWWSRGEPEGVRYRRFGHLIE